jgi:hypothetical protein
MKNRIKSVMPNGITGLERVKENVELYLYTLSGSSWPVIG